MIDSGDKPEEYRDLTWYWSRRLLGRVSTTFGYWFPWSDILSGDYEFSGWKSHTGGTDPFQQFDCVEFRHGYRKDARRMRFLFSSTSIGTGQEKWGAEPGKKYFVIKLGERI